MTRWWLLAGIQLNDYSKWLKSNGKSDDTIISYNQVAMQFQKWFLQRIGKETFKGKYVSALDLQEWKSYLIDEATYVNGKKVTPKKYSIRSVITFIKAIKCYFEYLQEIGEINSNPAIKVEPPKIQMDDDDDPRWLERIERTQLLTYINDEEMKDKNRWRYTRNRAIIFLGLHAGLRRCEIVHFEVEDIYFEKGYVFVRDGKGCKSRRVPMNTDLRKALTEWLEQRGEQESSNVFISQKRGPITRHTLNKMCTTIGKKIKLNNFGPHVLRHTFGHDLAVKGTRLEHIADLMGHSNVNFTRVYTRSIMKERSNVVESISEERSD